MKQASFKDVDGRWYAVWLPDDADTAMDAPRGVIIGPPPLEALGLPDVVSVRLHNELFHRGLYTAKDVMRRRQDLLGALLSALKVDADTIVTAYVNFERG